MSAPAFIQTGLSRLLAGPTVEIIVDVSKPHITVHANALRACHSPSLNALLKQDWAEGHDRKIDWTKQDGPTIDRFATYLYLRDYSVPDPQPCSLVGCSSSHISSCSKAYEGEVGDANVHLVSVRVEPAEFEPAPEPEPEPEPEVLQEPEQEQGEDTVAHTDWPEEESSAMQNVIAESCGTRTLTPINGSFLAGLPEKHRLTEAGLFEEQSYPYDSHHYIEVLLAHAKVYTFASYHLIESLQNLSLQRLTQTLMQVDCQQPHAACEVATLTRHIYDNTVLRASKRDPARKLVSQFAAFYFEDLNHGDFEILLEEGSDFVLDMTRKVSRRLRELEDKSRELQRVVKIQKDELQKSQETSNQWGALSTGGKKKATRY